MYIIHVISDQFFVNFILVKYDYDVVYISSTVWYFSILRPMTVSSSKNLRYISARVLDIGEPTAMPFVDLKYFFIVWEVILN